MGKAGTVNDLTKQRNLDGYGLKIKKYRKRAGLTAEELADALGVTVSTVRNWECGLTRPDPECLYSIFPALDVDPNEFFGLRGVGDALSDRERRVVSLFRSLDARGQDDFVVCAQAMADHCHTLALREVRGRIVSLPDYGRFAAAGSGDGWSQVTDTEEVLLYDTGPASQADEVVTISGHSMEPAFHDGDRVLVKHCTDMELGDVYVFSVRGMGCLIKEAAPDRLHSQNPDYEDIVPWEEDGAELIGRVLGVVEQSMFPSAREVALYREALASLKD